MANFVKTFVPFISSVALLLALLNTASSQTTSFYYDFYGQQPPSLIYQGDAHFPSDTTYLRLTKTNASGYPENNSIGRVVHATPVQFWETGAQVDFETTLRFIITPVNNNPGDGIVFFIAPVGTTPGNGGGSLGVFTPGGNPSTFVVEFDTFSNPADPDYRHVGIDIENQRSRNLTRVDDAILGQEVTARINYVAATKLISVTVSAGNNVYEVSYVLDLSTVLNQQVQVGLSATTGGAISVHDVVSWYFTATLVHGAGKEDIKIQQYV